MSGVRSDFSMRHQVTGSQVTPVPDTGRGPGEVMQILPPLVFGAASAALEAQREAVTLPPSLPPSLPAPPQEARMYSAGQVQILIREALARQALEFRLANRSVICLGYIIFANDFSRRGCALAQFSCILYTLRLLEIYRLPERSTAVTICHAN